MATVLKSDHATLGDFLAWEHEQPDRYERLGGVVRMMTGGTIDHNRITLNVADGLRRRLAGGDCEKFVNDVKVVTPTEDVMYPDVVIACGVIPGKATVLPDPVVVVEVLSESTAARDHGRKRWAYQTIPSLRHYVLIDQDEVGVEVASPDPTGGWRSVILRRLEDCLQLPALNVEIGLDEVFARVTLGRSPDATGATEGA
jgi:Uma2 family endonuclease